jgi:hypothetical protein
VPVSPTRICDSRGVVPEVIVANQCNGNGAGPAPIGADQTKVVTITGDVVPEGATAAVLNVTSVDSTGAGHFTIHPHGEVRPNASDLNWPGGYSVPNLVIVKLPPDGRIDIFSAVHGAHVIVDVEGYYVVT